MHAPIIYLTQDREKVLDLNKPEEKETFMDTIFPEGLQDEFEDYVSISDWWFINTIDEPGWHRGEWDIKGVVEEELKRVLGTARALIETIPGVYEITVTKDDAVNYYQQQNDQLRAIAAKLETDAEENLKQFVQNMGRVQYDISHMDSDDIQSIHLDDESVVGLIELLFHTIVLTDKPQTFYIYTSIQGDYHY